MEIETKKAWGDCISFIVWGLLYNQSDHPLIKYSCSLNQIGLQTRYCKFSKKKFRPVYLVRFDVWARLSSSCKTETRFDSWSFLNTRLSNSCSDFLMHWSFWLISSYKYSDNWQSQFVLMKSEYFDTVIHRHSRHVWIARRVIFDGLGHSSLHRDINWPFSTATTNFSYINAYATAWTSCFNYSPEIHSLFDF